MVLGSDHLGVGIWKGLLLSTLFIIIQLLSLHRYFSTELGFGSWCIPTQSTPVKKFELKLSNNFKKILLKARGFGNMVFVNNTVSSTDYIYALFNFFIFTVKSF